MGDERSHQPMNTKFVVWLLVFNEPNLIDSNKKQKKKELNWVMSLGYLHHEKVSSRHKKHVVLSLFFGIR